MKFWFVKKESSDEVDIMTTDASAVVTQDSDSASFGDDVAETFPQPEKADDGGGVHGASAAASADYGTGKEVTPGQSSSAPNAAGLRLRPKPKPIVSIGTTRGESAPAANVAETEEAAKTPILKAIPLKKPSGSAARIRPVVSIKPKAQGPGLAALAVAATHGNTVKGIGGLADAAEPVKRADTAAAQPPVAADPDNKEATENAEQNKATTESYGIPVRPKPDQRALYYQLINGLYDAILILDEKGFVVDCNSRLTKVLGYAREDSWDLPISKIITGMSTRMLEHLKRNLAENHHIMLDARCLRKDGTSFTAEIGVSVFSLTRGDNMVFMIRNVERRKQAMDELRKSHAALETALSPAFVCDADGFFEIVNTAFLESFSIPDAEQAKALRFADLLPDGARSFLRAACGEKIREKLLITLPDGGQLSLDMALAPVQSGQTITGVAGSIMPI
jgi:PAS domain S-box-containing protein